MIILCICDGTCWKTGQCKNKNIPYSLNKEKNKKSKEDKQDKK